MLCECRNVFCTSFRITLPAHLPSFSVVLGDAMYQSRPLTLAVVELVWEISRILCNPVHNCFVRNSPQREPVLSQINSLNSLTICCIHSVTCDLFSYVLAVRGFFNERWIAPSVEGSSSPAFKLLFWHCPESMEEDHEKPRSPYRVFKMRIELLGPKEDEANQLDQNVRRHILFI